MDSSWKNFNLREYEKQMDILERKDGILIKSIISNTMLFEFEKLFVKIHKKFLTRTSDILLPPLVHISRCLLEISNNQPVDKTLSKFIIKSCLFHEKFLFSKGKLNYQILESKRIQYTNVTLYFYWLQILENSLKRKNLFGCDELKVKLEESLFKGNVISFVDKRITFSMARILLHFGDEKTLKTIPLGKEFLRLFFIKFTEENDLQKEFLAFLKYASSIKEHKNIFYKTRQYTGIYNVVVNDDLNLELFDCFMDTLLDKEQSNFEDLRDFCHKCMVLKEETTGLMKTRFESLYLLGNRLFQE